MKDIQIHDIPYDRPTYIGPRLKQIDSANWCYPPPTVHDINVSIGVPDIKSRLRIGNLIIHNSKHFNWFHRLMWRICFGIKIKNIKENRHE